MRGFGRLGWVDTAVGRDSPLAVGHVLNSVLAVDASRASALPPSFPVARPFVRAACPQAGIHIERYACLSLRAKDRGRGHTPRPSLTMSPRGRSILIDRQRELEGQLSLVVNADAAHLYRWLATHVDAIRDLAREVAQSDRAIESIAATGYSHTNGFFKMTLVHAGQAAVRLHHWTGDDAAPLSPHIHDHRWPLASKVIEGKVAMTLYGLSLHGEEVAAYEYTPASKTTGEGMKSIGQANIAVQTQALLPEHGSYCLSEEVLHTARAIAQDTVTVVVHSAPRRATTTVLTAPTTSPAVSDRAAISPAHVRAALGILGRSRDDQ